MKTDEGLLRGVCAGQRLTTAAGLLLCILLLRNGGMGAALLLWTLLQAGKMLVGCAGEFCGKDRELDRLQKTWTKVEALPHAGRVRAGLLLCAFLGGSLKLLLPLWLAQNAS